MKRLEPKLEECLDYIGSDVMVHWQDNIWAKEDETVQTNAFGEDDVPMTFFRTRTVRILVQRGDLDVIRWEENALGGRDPVAVEKSDGE